MATKTIKSKLKVRSDSNYNWNYYNPVLAEGEFAYNTDTTEIRIGDGTKTYNKLPNIVSEALMSWGGANKTASFSPIDASLVSSLGANRFAYLYPKAIEVYYSRDAGQTWLDYGATDTQLSYLTSPVVSTWLKIGNCQIGEAPTKDWMLRIVINTRNDNYGDTINHIGVYSRLNKFIINLTTNYSSNCKVTIDGRLETNRVNDVDTWTVFASDVDVAGWSGYNVINTTNITTYGNSPAIQYGQLRFTFSHGSDVAASETTTMGLQVTNIYAYGGMGWRTPSTLAKTNTLYSVNDTQGAIFPSTVKATELIENNVPLISKYSTLANTGKTLALTNRTVHIRNSAGIDLSTITFPLATTTTDGWMSSTDKARVDNTVDLTSSQTISGRKVFSTGVVFPSEKYVENYSDNTYTPDNYGIYLRNSDITGVNTLRFSDLQDNAKEGIQFYRTSTTVDSLWVKNGEIKFTPNRTLGYLGDNTYDVQTSEHKGVANGIASLDASAKVPLTQLPTLLSLGETSTTAYYGDKGKTAYEHSQVAHAPSNAERNTIVGVQVNGTDQTITSARKVNLAIPTKVSDLLNDSGYLTEHQSLDNYSLTSHNHDSIYSKLAHTHSYAGSSTVGGSANSVANSLIVKLNSGTTEGTNLFTFNGSTAKTINITKSSIGLDNVLNVASYSKTETDTLLSEKANASHIHSIAEVNGLDDDIKEINEELGNKLDATATAINSSRLSNTSAIGSSTKPVYFSANGVPVAIGYTIQSNVPSGAKFTDTTYSDATTSIHGLMSATDKSKLDNIESGAEVNIIESIKTYNGTALSISNKSVSLPEYALKSDISTTYKACGSITTVGNPSDEIVGNVYNVSTSFTVDNTSTYFVDEAKGKTFPAGTNIVCVEVSSSKKWDVLSGYIDLSGYVEKETDKGLSTNDYTNAEKTKLSGIEAGAEVNVIETIQLNGTPLTPTSKTINIPFTAGSGLTLSGTTFSANIYNGLDSTSTSQSLSANQGKILKGSVDLVASDLSTHATSIGNPHSVTKSQVGLGNVTNESKATMFTSPTFTGIATLPLTTKIGTLTSTGFVKYANGNLSVDTTSYTEDNHTHTLTPSGSVSSSFTGTSGTTSSASVNTTVASSNHTHTLTPSGSVAISSSADTNGNYTPSGTIGTISYTQTSTNTGASSNTNVNSVSGVGTLPSLTATIVDSNCLEITFGTGTLPTYTSVSVAASSHTHTYNRVSSISTPTFTGTKVQLSATFTGASGTTTTISGTSTVASSTHTHTLTPSGTVSSTFSGTSGITSEAQYE